MLTPKLKHTLVDISQQFLLYYIYESNKLLKILSSKMKVWCLIWSLRTNDSQLVNGPKNSRLQCLLAKGVMH